MDSSVTEQLVLKIPIEKIVGIIPQDGYLLRAIGHINLEYCANNLDSQDIIANGFHQARIGFEYLNQTFQSAVFPSQYNPFDQIPILLNSIPYLFKAVFNTKRNVVEIFIYKDGNYNGNIANVSFNIKYDYTTCSNWVG